MYSIQKYDRGRSQTARRVFLGGSVVCLLVGWSATGGQSQFRANEWSDDVVVPSALAEMERAGVELPMEVNERVEFWMRRFMREKSVFEDMLSRAGLYSDMIRSKLRDRGMPEELIYLAMIESGFFTDARSRVAATGVWQFMGPTARAYGLRVDSYVDERRDPVRATDAALDYLDELHGRFGSWYLAAAAYNAGPTRVSRALRRHAGGRVGEESLYWEIIDHLPPETAQYVPKLLAATYLARYASRYAFDVRRADPYAYDLVWTPGGTSLRAVAESVGASADRLYDLNPHLIRGMVPPGAAYPLRVPVGQAMQVVAMLGMPDRRTRRADD